MVIRMPARLRVIDGDRPEREERALKNPGQEEIRHRDVLADFPVDCEPEGDRNE